ncbi:MAG: TolC family outer membrane protein [Sphingomonadales bacterium]|nr:TolC family outer membrane protein [Sphingomonadales bacterium]
MIPASRRRRAAVLLCAAALFATEARADDLRGALLTAYATNPTLLSARDSQRATDEGVPIAAADGRPSASVSASETEYVKQSLLLSPSAAQRFVSVSGTLTVPLYSGGAVRNAVRAADRRTRAGEADLRGSESALFSQVVGAYMDVILDESVLRLNQVQVQTLRANLQSTNDRFQIGDVTRTDVAQSQSRLALAEGDLRNAEANLAAAREHYIQIVGKPPAALEPPPPLPGLPADAEDAVAYALDHNPDIFSARERSTAARYDTKAAGASRLPKLSLFADGQYGDYLGTFAISGLYFPIGVLPQSGTTGDVGVRASIPLYQGGRPSAQISQAEARESASFEDEIASERSVIAQVRSAFSAWQAANAVIGSTTTAVDAARLSLEGVRAENSVGNRTVLDVLNAEQELVSAQEQLATARRNAYVAGFTLLAAMGRAEARDLGLDGGALYDPDVHARSARDTLWDWGADRSRPAQATRTVDTPVQNGAILPP